MRALAIAALVAATAGCGGTRNCKKNTVLVTVDLDAASAASDSLTLTIKINGETETRTVAHSSSVAKGTVEIDFDNGYPSGQMIDVAVQALAGGAVVGTGENFATLGPTCTPLEVDVAGASVGNDLAVGDGGGMSGDLAAADLSSGLSTDFSACTDVFVSPSGDDANSGCDPTVPRKTIGAALGVGTATDIRVCKGTYPEHVQVATAVALHGGYDCTSWTRTASYGYPNFDGVNETILAPTTAGPAVAVQTGGVTVEGFTMHGVDGAGITTVAMAIATGGAAVVHDNHIVGGGTSSASSGFGSIGLNVLSTTMSDIYANLVNGGSGSTTSLTAAGSVGVVLGAPGLCHLHGNTIQGGTGSAIGGAPSSTMVTGAVGLFFESSTSAFTAANGNAVEDNVITGGNPGSAPITNNNGAGSIAVRIANTQGGAVDLVHNTIDGGIGTGGSTASAIGVAQLANVIVNVVGNRINGGSWMTTPAPSGSVATMGILAISGSNFIINNMIHGGNSGASTTLPAEGIRMAVSNATITHNTIFGGAAMRGVGIHVASGIFETVVNENFYFGVESSIQVMLQLDSCATAGPLASWQGNSEAFAFAMAYGPNTGMSGSCSNGLLFGPMSGASTEIATCTAATAGKCNSFGGTTVGNNTWLDSTCTGGNSLCSIVAGCNNPDDGTADPTMCGQEIFTSYDKASFGLADLQGAGWKLKSGAPCPVSKSAFDDTAAVPKDLYGTTRTNPPSVGAHEFDGTCM
ncbi:MAG TPA: hypothetical protein VN947_27630 [Polyangia bacterium]|nr:hypothetical protein [Polyangia bacterium]